jgi:hypothetical protein
MRRTTIGLLAFSGMLTAQQPLPVQPVPARPVLIRKAQPVVNTARLKDDTQTLSEMKLDAKDPVGLIGYFKSRTLDDAQMAKVKGIIRRMGDESFEERMKASEEAAAFGLGAVGPLRNAAAGDPDPEIAFRSYETLKSIEKVPQAAVASAAARALAASKHPEAVAALLAFLPGADNAAVEDDLRLAIKELAVVDGKVDASIAKALQDPQAVRRSAAAVALIEYAIANPAKNAEIEPLIAPVLNKESDSDAKFRMAFPLATQAKLPAAFAALAECLPGFGDARGRIWQIEDVLVQLAGANPPPIRIGAEKPALEKARDEWIAFLNAKLKPENYKAFNYKPRTNGHLQMLWTDNNWNGGRIVELGADMRQRWRVANIMAPADFRVLPNGNIELLEFNYNRFREIDRKGTQVKSRQINEGQARCLQHLPNGNILLACNHAVIEYDAKWTKVNSFTRVNNQDILAAGKYENGPIWVLVQNPPSLIRLDDQWKEAPDPIKVNNPHYQPKMEFLPGDRVLITEQNRIVEIDLKTGKEVWNYACNTPHSMQRLPNGNTLVCDGGDRSIREISPEREVLWRYVPPDGLMPLRAYRQ